MCDTISTLLSEYEFNIKDIKMPPEGKDEKHDIIIKKDGEKHATVRITILGTETRMVIDTIRRDKLKSSKGLGKLILYFLACVSKTIGCSDIQFEASSSKKYNANAQVKLETYYNSLGFIKDGDKTKYGTQPYSTPVDTIISRIESEYKPESSGGKRRTRHKPKRRYRNSTRK